MIIDFSRSLNRLRPLKPWVRYGKLNALSRLWASLPEDDRRYLNGETLREGQKEFISSVSHELKTPLTSLRLSVELMSQVIGSREGTSGRKTPPLSPATLQRLAENADRQVSRLSEVMENLFEATTLKAETLSLVPETMDLAELAREEIARLQATPGHRRSLIDFLAEGPVLGHWDRKRLRQALRNLLSNALLYGRDRPIVVRVTGEPGFASLSVEDRGIGIESQDQARIFELFERGVSSDRFEGLGVGLYVASQIATAHRGEIRLASRVGEGSCFTMRLPRR